MCYCYAVCIYIYFKCHKILLFLFCTVIFLDLPTHMPSPLLLIPSNIAMFPSTIIFILPEELPLLFFMFRSAGDKFS